MITISLKSEVDQFASPPPGSSLHNTGTLSRCIRDSLVWSVFHQQRGCCSHLHRVCISDRYVGCLCVGTFPTTYRLDEKISLWILSTRMFPAIVTAVPLFLMMRDLRLLNTKASLIIVYTGVQSTLCCLDDAWLFLPRFQKDLEEAALIDGDSRLGALFAWCFRW